MIVGDVNRFAIESVMKEATENEHFLGWGLFVVHILGNEYGVRDDEANSFSGGGWVDKLLDTRGTRINFRLGSMAALALADEYLDARYREEPKGFPERERASGAREFHSPACYWPPPDRAFDDGSNILLFDIAGDDVRIVSFINADGCQVERLADLTMPAHEFYQILANWRAAFIVERGRLLAETRIAE